MELLDGHLDAKLREWGPKGSPKLGHPITSFIPLYKLETLKGSFTLQAYSALPIVV